MHRWVDLRFWEVGGGVRYTITLLCLILAKTCQKILFTRYPPEKESETGNQVCRFTCVGPSTSASRRTIYTSRWLLVGIGTLLVGTITYLISLSYGTSPSDIVSFLLDSLQHSQRHAGGIAWEYSFEKAHRTTLSTQTEPSQTRSRPNQTSTFSTHTELHPP